MNEETTPRPLSICGTRGVDVVVVSDDHRAVWRTGDGAVKPIISCGAGSERRNERSENASDAGVRIVSANKAHSPPPPPPHTYTLHTYIHTLWR